MSKMFKVAATAASILFLVLPQAVDDASAAAEAVANPSPIWGTPVYVRAADEGEFSPLRMHYRRIGSNGRSRSTSRSTSGGRGFGASSKAGGRAGRSTNNDVDNNNNSNEDNDGFISFDVPLNKVIGNALIDIPDPAGRRDGGGGGGGGGGEGTVARVANLVLGVVKRPEPPRRLVGRWEGYVSGGPSQADEVRCLLSTSRQQLERESRNPDFLNALNEWTKLDEMVSIPTGWNSMLCIAFMYHSIPE